MRTLVIQLGLFALPFLLFWLYLKTGRRTTTVPVFWLALVGAALTLIGFVVFAQVDGAPPGSTYVPARVENGEFLPGGFIAPDESATRP